MAELKPTVDVVTTAEGFHGLAAEWDHLLDQSDQRSFFLRSHWNRAWWDHLAPPEAELSIVCCRDASGALVGVAPLYVKVRRVLPLMRLRELHLLGTGTSIRINEHMDVFARAGWEAVVAQAIADALKARKGWDRLSLDSVPADTTVASRLTRALGLERETIAGDRAPYIDTTQGWEHYKRSLGRSMRRNVEYYPRRLFQQRACAFERVTTQAQVREAMDDLVRLHQARWQSAGEPGSFANPLVERFLRDAAGAAWSAGQLRLWRLRIDGAVEAALIGFLENGTLHYFQTGFNPARAKDDLGTVIVALAVKECCDDPAVRAFDFMGGKPGYKSMWARQERELVRHEAWRFNLRTLADRAWARSRAATARIYRAAAPRALREARRRWHRQRRLAEA